MSDLLSPTDKQMQRIAPYFPLSHGVLRVDGRRMVRRIIFDLQRRALAGCASGIRSAQNDRRPVHPLNPNGHVQPHFAGLAAERAAGSVDERWHALEGASDGD